MGAAFLAIGMDAGSHGTLDVTDSTVWLEGNDGANAGLELGHDEAIGILNLNSAA